jgi:hypothetical protein
MSHSRAVSSFPFLLADGTARVSFGHRETYCGGGIWCRGGGLRGKFETRCFLIVHLACGCLKFYTPFFFRRLEVYWTDFLTLFVLLICSVSEVLEREGSSCPNRSKLPRHFSLTKLTCLLRDNLFNFRAMECVRLGPLCIIFCS